MILKYYIRARK